MSNEEPGGNGRQMLSLGPYGLMAERHWLEHLPAYHKMLKDAGLLREELALAESRAAEAVQERLGLAMAQDGLLEPVEAMRSAQSAQKMAEEAILPLYILLPPEDESRLMEEARSKIRTILEDRMTDDEGVMETPAL